MQTRAKRAKRHKYLSAEASQQEYSQETIQRTLGVQYEGQEVDPLLGKFTSNWGRYGLQLQRHLNSVRKSQRERVPRSLVSCSPNSQVIKRLIRGFPGGAVVESLPASAGDTGSSPGLGRSHMPRSSWACEPQLLSLRVWSLCSATREAAIVRGPRTAMKSGPRLPQLEKALAQKRRPNTAINQ